MFTPRLQARALRDRRARRAASPGAGSFAVASRGAAAIEWLVVAPALLAVGFGVLQAALLMHGRSSVEYAAFQGARAGAVRHADPEAIIEGMAIGFIGLRDAALAAAPVSVSGPAAQAILVEELASGVAAWRQLRPTPADFADWAVPARDEEGRPLAGIIEIPNDNLRFRGSASGPGSGRSLVEANLLEIELVYAWPMRVPLIGSLAVRWMEWFDRCDGAREPSTASHPWGRADWRIGDGAWRCAHYRAGGVSRWPLRVTASARMHSPARHAGAGTGPVSSASASGPDAPAAEPAGDPGMSPGADAPSAIPTPPDSAPPVADASSAADRPAGADGPPIAESVDDRADIPQPGECFADSGQAAADSGQAEMDVGDEEAALAPAVEALAAETVAVQAR